MQTRNGVELNVIEHGPGPIRVVMVHGLASNARLWDGVAADLLDLGTSSAAVDLRGHGDSGRPDTGYDMATVADEVFDVVVALSDTPVILAGQSWGGNVVVECAARHPDVVRAVVGVDGGLISLAEDFSDMDQVWDALAPPRFEGLTLEVLEPMIRSRLQGWPETAVAGALANFETTEDGSVRSRLSRERHRAILEGLFAHDPRKSLQAVAAPVLMLLTAQSAGRMADVHNLGDRIRIEVVDADHDVHAQYPSLVATLISEMA